MTDARPPHTRAGRALLAVAIAVRAIEYLHNKALWLDEAHLALNILRRDFAGLTERLDYGQGAPLGFLWAERAIANALGPGEFALRLLPLAASLASCFLLYTFLRRTVPARGLLVAWTVFALAVPITRYAAEVKPYATDLVVALALYLLLLRIERKPLTSAYAALLAIIGAIGIWLAFPAVFVLGGMGTVHFTCAAIARERKRAALLAGVGAVWVASIVLDYAVMLRHNAENAELRTWWLDRFMPLPPMSLSDTNWFVRTCFESFADPLGLGTGGAGIGALLFALGMYAVWRRDRPRLALLLAPIVVGLLASGMQLYPFMGRFLLYLVPILLAGIGEGWTFLAENVRQRAVLAAAGLVLLIQPVAATAKGVLKPGAEGIRPAFACMRDRWQDSDRLYVYCWAVPLFEYYEIKAGAAFPKTAGRSLRADWAGYRAELEPLRGEKRVWFVLTNTPRQLVGQEDKFLLTHLDTIGQRIDSGVFDESSAYLYDLSAPPGRSNAPW